MESDTSGTRARLLEAAGETFAELGFRETTVREICRRAGANIAAVNYHFGDKEKLYREALTYAARVAMEAHPIGAGVRPDAPAPDRLEGFVRNFLNRLLDEGRPAWHGTLIAREMVEPTGALDELARNYARPQLARLREIVAELLGPAASGDPDLVRQVCTSVVGQCLFFKTCRPMVERVMPEQGYGPQDRARLIRHIAAFSLGAIAELRRRAKGAGA